MQPPNDEIVEEKLTELRSEQPLKASLPTVVMPSSITIFLTKQQFMNPFAAIVVILYIFPSSSICEGIHKFSCSSYSSAFLFIEMLNSFGLSGQGVKQNKPTTILLSE